MRIIREPQFNVCECERCGTIFQPEASDDLYYKFKDDEPWSVEKVFVRCPTCSSNIEVTKEPERYFAPEDVRKMSVSEVRENYSAIMDSMKDWN